MYRFLLAKPDSVGQAENNWFFLILRSILSWSELLLLLLFLFFPCSRGFASLAGFLIKTIWLIKVTLSLNLRCTLLQEFSHSLLLSLFSPADVFTRFFIVLHSFYHHQSIPPPGHWLKQKGKRSFLYLGWNYPNWNEPGVTPGIAGRVSPKVLITYFKVL